FLFFFFFFFQAEDGIRDRNVTGVQTCALPISWYLYAAVGYTVVVALVLLTMNVGNSFAILLVLFVPGYVIVAALFPGSLAIGKRSEERRVGKECRARWWKEH